MTSRTVRTPTARAKLTNGTRGMVLPGIDQRSAIARRYRDVIWKRSLGHSPAYLSPVIRLMRS